MMSRKLSALFLLFVLLPLATWAQVPAQVDPSKVENRFDEPLAAPSGKAAPDVPADIAPAEQSAEGERADDRFILRDVLVVGMTAYSEEEMRPLASPPLPRIITVAEAYAIAQAFTLKYRTDGYFLSQARLKEIDEDSGTILIEVIEGFISNISISGETPEGKPAQEIIKGYAEKIRGERPLHISTMERYLLLMDDLPGVSVESALRASDNTFAAADLYISLKQKEFDFVAGINNRGSRYIGPWQGSASVTANSSLGMYDRTTISGALSSDTEELRYVEVMHEQLLGDDGLKLIVRGSHSKTQPGGSLSVLEIEGFSDAYSFALSYPWLRSRSENLTLHAMFDYRSTDTNFLGSDFSNDRLRTLRVGYSWDVGDEFNGSNLVNSEVSQGLNIFNASESGFERSRTNGQSDFTKITLNTSRTQPFLYPGVSLFTSFSGQYAANKLLASEQFAIGGQAFGSAYDPSELTGDHGVAARLELQYSRFMGWDYLSAAQIYGFYDVGAVWNRDTLNTDNSLASAGFGFRSNLTENLSGTLEFAVPLTKEVSAERNHDPRMFFGLTSRF